MDEENLELLNMNQEDDNLIGINPANLELRIHCVSPLSPSMMPKASKHAGMDDLQNCSGKLDAVGEPAVAGADFDLTMAHTPCRSPIFPNSGPKVLSVLNFNEVNKRSAVRDAIGESKTRKSFGIRESVQLDGIAETSPVMNPGSFTNQLSRSYLDIENEQAGVTPGKGRRESTVTRKSRSRRSTMLRKSLAWDKAFLTDEGVLDNDELFAVASDSPKTLAMPELAAIWHGPQNLETPLQETPAPAKTKLRSEVRPESRPGLNPVVRPEMRTEARPEVRSATDPKPQRDIFRGALRGNVSYSPLQPLQRIHTTGSHAFSNAYSRAAAIPLGSTSMPLPSSLTRTAKPPGVAARHLIDHSHGAVSDIQETRNTTTGLHHQARVTALRKANEAPAQKGPRVRLANSISNKKVEDKLLEDTQKRKQLKKAEIKAKEEVPQTPISRQKQPRKLEDKPSEDIRKASATLEKRPTLTRSMSTSSLHDSPSALSRKVSLMSKRVKETLGKVMSGRARRVPPDTSLSHVHPVEKGSLFPKTIGGLLSVPEVKDPNHETRSNSAAAPMKDSKEMYTVRDILRGNGPPTFPKGASKQGPILSRSKSAFTAPGISRAADPGVARDILAPAPSALTVFPATSPLFIAAKPTGKPSSLRKPSPKLSFFDAGGATSAQHKTFAISQPFNCTRNSQPLRPSSEASTPIEAGSRGLPPSTAFSAIPTAPHLRHCVASAPTSPRRMYSMHPTSPKSRSAASPRPDSSTITSVNLVNLSGLLKAKQFADSHQLLAKKIAEDGHGVAGVEIQGSALDALKLPSSKSPSIAVDLEPNEFGHGIFSRNFDEGNPSIEPAANFGSSVHSVSTLESGGGEPDDNSLMRSSREAVRSGDESSASASPLFHETCSQRGGDFAFEDRTVSGTVPPIAQDGIEEVRENIASPEAMESSVAPRDPTPASPSLSSSNVRSHRELTNEAGFNCFSPHNSSFSKISAAGVRSCLDTNKPVLDTDVPPSACPSTPTRKECPIAFSPKISRQFESPRSTSFRESSLRPKTAAESPAPANKHVRSFSQRLPWQSPGVKAVGSSPGLGPTPSSAGKSHTVISPSHAPDLAGTFEVITPTSSKNARRERSPGSSSKKVIRKIVEFESPSSQWSNWPVLGAAISADQLPVSGTQGLSSSPCRPSGEQATEQAPLLQAKCPSNSSSSSLSKARLADLPRATNEHCTLDTEQPTDLRLSFSSGFASSGYTKPAKSAEIESGPSDRNSSVGPSGEEVCVSAKKDRRSSMFSFAKKAVARLTLSPTQAEPSGQDLEETPKPSIKMSRRFSRSGSSAPAPDPKPPNLFSEARICELEAAGVESMQKKNGPVTNSPPDKILPDSNPWSPVRKNHGQPLGPFDCTKLTYISRGLVNS